MAMSTRTPSAIPLRAMLQGQGRKAREGTDGQGKPAETKRECSISKDGESAHSIARLV